MTTTDELTTAVRTLRTARFTGAMTATPAVAALLRARKPIAEWLEFVTSDAEQRGRLFGDDIDQLVNPHALATARAINGTQQTGDTE